MLRRMAPTLAILGLGLVALVFGLGSLQRIFISERKEAHEQVWAQRNALEEYARRTLEQMLEAELHMAADQIDWARGDPLAATSNLLLVEDGTQRFPRRVAYAEGASAPARDLVGALRSGKIPRPEEADSPWAERLGLYRELRGAVAHGSDDGIAAALGKILQHRTLYLIRSDLDVPFLIALLDYLLERTNPDPDLLAGLLRDGIGDGRHTEVEGLQPGLLRRRERFSVADFQYLSGMVIELSERAHVHVEDFRARTADPVTVALPVPPRLSEPSLVLDSTWYARPDGANRIIGVQVSVDEKVAAIEYQMRARALLEPQDALRRPPRSTKPLPLSTLDLAITSPRFEAAIDAGDQRFWVKTGFAALSGALALVIVALALMVQSRKQRFIELKSDFVATVSHELRTPLASIRLMAETLERRTAGISAARDYPSRIVGEIDELTFLVENILSFNRLDKGRWRPRQALIELQELIDEIENELGSVGDRRVEIVVHGLAGVTLQGDRELLKLLLRNLAHNACAYNRRSPIRIAFDGTRTPRGGLTVDVTDNGIGIAEAERRKVFADFYRVDKAGGGSGLGLAICRKTMQAHGGRIRVADSSLEGTTFELRFPATMVMPP